MEWEWLIDFSGERRFFIENNFICLHYCLLILLFYIFCHCTVLRFRHEWNYVYEILDMKLYCIKLIFLLKKFCCYSITVVCIFSPSLHPTPAEPTSLSHLHPPPWYCPCVLYSSSCKPLSPLSIPHSPLAIDRLFLTSMSLVIFCLLFSLVDYGTFTQWYSTQQREGRSSYPLQQHGWNWRALR